MLSFRIRIVTYTIEQDILLLCPDLLLFPYGMG